MNGLVQIALLLVSLLFVAYIVRQLLVQTLKQRVATNLWWVTRPLDTLARRSNSCGILRQQEDIEIENCQIQIVEPTCESGLPHTSDANTIRLTESVWNSTTRESTLKHERVHILQRRFPSEWSRFYQEFWSYTLHTQPPSNMPQSQSEKLRSNPDTAKEPWCCWQNRYWFAPLYKDTEHPTLLGVDIRIWDDKERRWVSESPEEWRTLFCGDGKCPHQWEHPHELAAELWTADAFNTAAGYSLKKFMNHLLSLQ